MKTWPYSFQALVYAIVLGIAAECLSALAIGFDHFLRDPAKWGWCANLPRLCGLNI